MQDNGFCSFEPGIFIRKNVNERIKVGLGIRILIHTQGEKNVLVMTMMK